MSLYSCLWLGGNPPKLSMVWMSPTELDGSSRTPPEGVRGGGGGWLKGGKQESGYRIFIGSEKQCFYDEASQFSPRSFIFLYMGFILVKINIKNKN